MSDILIVGDTLSSADLRHQIPVMVPDPIIYIEKPDHRVVFVKDVDVPLLGGLRGVDVVSFEEIRAQDAPPRGGANWYDVLGRLAVRACQAEEVRSALTPTRFPLLVADALRRAGVEVTPDEELFVQRRRVKTADQIAGMRRAIHAAESGWNAIRAALREEPEATSEELQARVLLAVAAHDVVPYDIIIVPHGPQTVIGHAGGSGPVRAGEPVIADLIMRDRETGAYADLTRTFCVGEPPTELVEYFELCNEALNAAISTIRPGTLATDLNAIASEIFEQAGYPTQRQNLRGATMDRGFPHSLGHGVGLEVHEPPSLLPGSDARLLQGDVLCIEPGLYRHGFGGCRLEDMVLVTGDGHERLSQYEYSLHL